MAKLTVDDIEQLKKFRLCVKESHSPLSIDGLDLLDESKLMNYFNRIQTYFPTENKAALGSMFIKRYAFIATIALYSMTILNKLLNVQLNNVSIESEEVNDSIWLPSIRLKFSNASEIHQDRCKRRDELLQSLFKENINLVIQSISKCTKVSKWILWENIAVYIFWMYESLLEDPHFSDQKKKIEDDFYYIVQKAEGKLFGNDHKNPLVRFYNPKVYNEMYQMEIRERTTCCLYYLTNEEKDRCRGCPCFKGSV